MRPMRPGLRFYVFGSLIHENQLDDPGRYHAELLRRMGLEIWLA